MTKIYTRKGDTGETGLFGGQRVTKSSLRVVCFGEVDELNATLGLAESYLDNAQHEKTVATVQNDLFTIGSHLSTPYDAKPPDHLPDFRTDGIAWQEHIIDELSASLPNLSEFILPGGSIAGATMHQARTVCRRAERSVVTLSDQEFVDPYILSYLNRLSDLLFTVARSINQEHHQTEQPWKKSNN